MSRLHNISLIRQEDSGGCLIACLAMVMGKTYAEVKAEFPREDVSTNGLSYQHVLDYVSEHGLALAMWREYSWLGASKERDEWPVKITADAAICGVDGGRGGAHSHGVVALNDGRILDPVHGERTWADYPKCGYIIQLFECRASPAEGGE